MRVRRSVEFTDASRNGNTYPYVERQRRLLPFGGGFLEAFVFGFSFLLFLFGFFKSFF